VNLAVERFSGKPAEIHTEPLTLSRTAETPQPEPVQQDGQTPLPELLPVYQEQAHRPELLPAYQSDQALRPELLPIHHSEQGYRSTALA
jgi:hypothetical protein